MIAPVLLDSLLPFDQLLPNEQARVVEVIGEDNEVHRLSEIGLRTGACLRMIRPGSPCLLALDGKRLSVRLAPNVDILVSAAP